MSDIKFLDTIKESETQYLPQELKTSSRYSVRLFSQDPSEAEDERIEELAKSMEEEGQLEALLVTPDLIVIAGHRRRRACIIINSKRAAQGAPLMRLRICIVRNGDLWRKSIISNIQHESFSPMDIAYIIKMIREDKDWRGASGTRRIATYLHVSYATIVQHERFYSLPKEIQNKLHDRTISAQSALEVISRFSDTSGQMRVLDRAAEIQATDHLEKVLNDCESHRISVKKATEALIKPAKHRIERPAIVKAIRETCTTVTKAMPLSKREIIQSIAQFDDEHFPEPVRDFARYWSRQFVLGQGDPTELQSRLLAILPKRKPIQPETVAV
jgi:ParB/RepB/Spo0J family partition protein